MNTPRTLSTFLLIILVIFSQFANAFPVYADDEPPTVPTDVAPTEEPSETDIPSGSDSPIVDLVSDPATPTDIAPTEEPGETDIPSGSDSPVVDAVDELTTPADIAPVEETSEEIENQPSEEPSLLEVVQELPAQTELVVLGENGEVLPLATQEAMDVIVEGDPFWCANGAWPSPGSPGCTISYTSLGNLLSAEGASIDADGTIWISAGTISDSAPIIIDGNTFADWATHMLRLQGGFLSYYHDHTHQIVYGENSSFSVPISIVNWTGAVFVNKITVNGATGTGLTVETTGDINLKDVTVTGSQYVNDSNPGNGADLNNTTGSGNVTLTGTNTFTGNAFSGLKVNTTGSFSSTGTIIANSNGTAHALTDAYGATINAASVTIGGTGNIFSSNYTDGLRVVIPGTISLSNVTAQSNGTTLQNSSYGYGAYLDNRTSTSDASVSVSGTNVFSSNYNTGLAVRSDGNIMLDNVSANNNIAGSGTYLNNRTSTNHMGVSVSGTNVFSNNYYAGLAVFSDGNITINNVISNNNIRGNGAQLDNTTSVSNASVSVNGTNVFSNNYYTGLHILSKGNITLADVTANNTVTANGLYVQSNGNIMLNRVTASNNIAGHGAYLDNTTGSGKVTLVGTNTFSGNAFSGLHVNTTGDFSSPGTLLASSNGTRHTLTDAYGATINAASVTIGGAGNIFSSNYSDGLWVATPGGISLSNITANSNNYGFYTAQAGIITVVDSQFNSNYSDGFHAEQSGDIEATNSEFNSNSGKGLYADNVGDINVANSRFNGNYWGGLYVKQSEDIKVTNSEFNGNYWSGLYVEQSGAIQSTGNVFNENLYGLWTQNVQSITTTNSSFNENFEDGLLAYFSGVINLVGTNTFNFNKNGLYLVSDTDVTIDGDLIANNNQNTGIFIQSAGDKSVALDSITANNNSCIGLQVSGPNDIQGTIISMTGNTIGLLIDNSNLSHDLAGWENITGNYIDITGTGADCIAKTVGATITSKTTPLVLVVFSMKNQAEFVLDCAHQSQYPVALPNNDLVTINCPVSGRAIIKRLDSTMLPGDLPAGYSYSSAFSLEVVQSGNAIKSIEEGGTVVVSFNVPNTQMGTTYSVLYWDADKKNWTPLKDFLLDENGNPRVFDLYPNDSRLILSGLNFVQDGETLRAELTTNFPGIFVLVQR